MIERKKTQVTVTLKIYGPRRMRRVGMGEKKEGSSAKEVDYSLMPLCAQQLHEGTI